MWCADVPVPVARHMFSPNFNRYSIPRRKLRAAVQISKKFNCVYVVTPKVACSTVLKAMQYFEVDEDTRRLPTTPHEHHESPLAKISKFPFGTDGALSDDSYYRFSFVRNPYTRVTSSFLDRFSPDNPIRQHYVKKLGYKGDEELTFLNFLHLVKNSKPGRLNKHWMPLSLLLQFDQVKYDFIGRFENFSEDLNHVLTTVYDKPYDDGRHRVDHHAVNASEKFRKIIGPEEKALIDEIYEQDFENFGYKKDLMETI